MRKISIIAVLLLFAGFAQAQSETDINGKVTVHDSENSGKYFSYVIVNEGTEVIEGGTYRIYLRVNKKNISFDRNTSDLLPGKAIRYESNQVFHKGAKSKDLKYSLEMTTKKPKRKHTLDEGIVEM